MQLCLTSSATLCLSLAAANGQATKDKKWELMEEDKIVLRDTMTMLVCVCGLLLLYLQLLYVVVLLQLCCLCLWLLMDWSYDKLETHIMWHTNAKTEKETGGSNIYRT